MIDRSVAIWTIWAAARSSSAGRSRARRAGLPCALGGADVRPHEVVGATGLSRNFEAFRYAMGRLPRDVYLAGYYRRWLGGLENVLVDRATSLPTSWTPG